MNELSIDGELVVFVQRARRSLLGLQNNDTVRVVEVADKNPQWRLIWEQFSLPLLVRRERLDLLHSLHYTRPLFLPCASVVTFHDMSFFLYPQLHTLGKRLFFPRAIRSSARRADALLTISESTRQDAINLLGIPEEKIFTTHLGVTPDFQPISNVEQLEAVRIKYQLPEKFLLYVGVVEPRKNLPLLIQSMRDILDEGIDHSLVMVGRMGWMYQDVLYQIDNLGLKEKINFAGYVPSEDLPMVYNLADVLVYPSVYEGFGLPPLEALACGTPVITTAVSSMPEHVGQAGILIPPGDGQALTQALLQVLTDRDLRKQLSKKGPEQAAQFTWKRTSQETLSVYHRVLAATNRR